MTGAREGAEVISLGCRLNHAESARLRAMLAGAGPMVVVNSCAVTGEALRQTRQAIRRARRTRPGARLVVTGCAAGIAGAELAAMPEVDALVGNAAKLDPAAWPGAAAAAIAPGRHSRAFIPVQTGCDHACTFCVIPQGRGPSRSRPAAEVIEDIASHCAQGAREAVLSGVDLTAWGLDLPGAPRLGALVAAILDALPQLPRLRLSSLDSVEIDPLLVELLAGDDRVMPHLHLSLQHGADLILKRMKRRHRTADVVALVEALRARRPGLAIGADLIAGFPTETPEHHAANLALIEALPVVHGHIFPFSPRPGTPAARMPQLLPEEVRRRAAQLRAAVAETRARWLAGLIGREQQVLAEKDGTGHAPDFSRHRLPPGTPAGAILTLTPTRIEQDLLA